jgi:hypothetical protein
VTSGWSRYLRAIAGGILLAALTLAAGCTHVPPYQRGRLAHPTMLLQETAGPGESHVYAIHEGAVGGGAAVEGGCGCN